jgi:hypothetical protein
MRPADEEGDEAMAKRRSDTPKKGDLVKYDDVTCRVLKRRRVTGMAMLSTCDYEIFLEALDGQEVGWIGENEVESISGEAGGT